MCSGVSVLLFSFGVLIRTVQKTCTDTKQAFSSVDRGMYVAIDTEPDRLIDPVRYLTYVYFRTS